MSICFSPFVPLALLFWDTFCSDPPQFCAARPQEEAASEPDQAIRCVKSHQANREHLGSLRSIGIGDSRNLPGLHGALCGSHEVLASPFSVAAASSAEQTRTFFVVAFTLVTFPKQQPKDKG